MAGDPIDEIIDSRLANPQQQCDLQGWTAWVDQEVLAMPRSTHNRRPWCRGRSGQGVRIHWFPRTSKRPRDGKRWAVYSPPNHLPKLKREGWFVANVYVTQLPSFEPAKADPCGVLPEAYVNAIYDRLQNFFRDRYKR